MSRGMLYGEAGLERLGEEIARQNGVMAEEIKDIRFLCREEDLQSRSSVSVRLMLSEAWAATRLQLSGAFVYSAFCRVVQYRPRPRLYKQQHQR
jgi:hypothetical protein